MRGAFGVKAIVVDANTVGVDVLDRWRARERRDPRLRRLADFPPHLVYAVPPVAAAPAITAGLAAPARLPARRIVRLGLTFAPRDGRAWLHPAPHGTSRARLAWTGSTTGQVVSESAAIALPLVVGGDGVVVPLRARTPDRPDRYCLRVTIHERGVDIGPTEIEVSAGGLPTSADGAHLAARYVTPVAGGPLKVAPLDYLALRVDAVNTGEAV